MKKLCISVCLGIMMLPVFAQDQHPVIGKPMPAHVFTDLVQYARKSAAISDFKGQWLILDIWSVYCGGCLLAMPKMNALYQKFKDKTQIIMVGSYDNRRPMEGIDTVLREKTKHTWAYMQQLYKLELPCAFDNSLATEWGDGRLSLPAIVCIDPEGVVRLITSSLTEQDVDDLLNGRTPKAERKYLPYEFGLDSGRTIVFNPVFDLDKNIIPGDSSLLYSSVLMRYSPAIKAFPTQFEGGMKYQQDKLKAQIELCGKLSELYYYAYSGNLDINSSTPVIGDSNFIKYPVLNVKDSSLFFDVAYPNHSREQSKNIFCYSLAVPVDKREDKAFTRQLMQKALKNYFGYNVKVEKRKVPVMYLVVTDRKKVEKLRSKGGSNVVENWKDGKLVSVSFKEPEKLARYIAKDIVNLPIGKLTMYFDECLPKLPQYKFPEFREYQVPLVDRTGLNFNIDMSIEAYERDYDGMVKEINKHGLGLVPGQMEANVIVISDPE